MHDWHELSAAAEILNSSFAFVSDKQEEKQPVLEIFFLSPSSQLCIQYSIQSWSLYQTENKRERGEKNK